MSLPEEWRPVVGHEGAYEVSNLGRVRSIERYVMRSNGIPQRISARIRKLTTSASGYLFVTLRAPGTRKNHTVHALVAEAFHGPRPFPDAECRHLDGDPTNNRAENLRWGTRSENTRDRVRHGTHNNAIKTHCPKGHPYDAANTYVNPKGSRECRICRRVSKNERRALARALRRECAFAETMKASA